jgi:hypothetical protein
VLYNTKNGVPFEVYLTEEQRRQFLELVRQDPGQAMLIFSRISTRQSTCWVLNDQLRIHSLIESSVGFEAVDKQVHQAIARALQPAAGNAYGNAVDTTPGDRSSPFVVQLTHANRETIVKWLQDGQGRGLLDGNRDLATIESCECTVCFK